MTKLGEWMIGLKNRAPTGTFSEHIISLHSTTRTDQHHPWTPLTFNCVRVQQRYTKEGLWVAHPLLHFTKYQS